MLERNEQEGLSRQADAVNSVKFGDNGGGKET